MSKSEQNKLKERLGMKTKIGLNLSYSLLIMFFAGILLGCSKSTPISEALYGEEENPCSKITKESNKIECYKNAFEKEDKKLNTLYRHLTKTLPSDLKAFLKKNSVEWIGLKETNCTWEVETTGKTTSSAEFYSCSLGYTTSRIKYLNSVFVKKKEKQPPGLGSFDDGLGGDLVIKETGDDSFHFQINVVRGPTYHIGELEGYIFIKGKKAEFKDSGECGENCCTMTFEFKDSFTSVEEDKCEEYRGARAYFAGLYARVE